MRRRRRLLWSCLLAVVTITGCQSGSGWSHSRTANHGGCVSSLTHSYNGGQIYQAQTIEQAACFSQAARLVYVHFDNYTYINSWVVGPDHALSQQDALSSPNSQHIICSALNSCAYGEN